MHCERCGVENRAGRRFCAACGAALPHPCSSCGFVNQFDDKFCGGCGIALRPEAATVPIRNDGAVEEFGERRQVTILFADLSGYTSLASRRDPEETHHILGRFFEAVDSVVTKYGGTIERHIGDNVMGVFGAPVAHGDDPLRAIKSAADIHDAVAGVSAEIGLPLSVHIGIAAGTVMASNTGSTLKAAYGVVGSPVNLAARLQGRAAAGETLVSPAVKDAVERYVELEPLGPVEFKGLDTPVHVWRVVGERAEAAAGTTLPLIGRRAEMGLLTSLLDAVRESGQGKVVQLRGEAGIGKTRITHKLAEEGCARGFSCHTALVLDFGAGQGRDATRALVGSLLGLTPDAPAPEREAAAARSIEDGTVRAEDMVFLADLLDVRQRTEDRALYDTMDPPARSRGRQEVTARLVRAMIAVSPLLLIVEDIHWIEPNILDDLAAISEIASTHPLVLAMTSRFEGDPIDNSFRTRGRAGITTIDLGPMRTEEASEFGKHLRIADDAVLKRCIARAEGNPLFLEQLLRNSEEGAVEGEVPASVQSLILARMDRLEPRDKAGLQAASISGQRFSIEFVRRLTNDPEFSPSTLLQHQMVRHEGAEFLFAHALVRDGVYSSITHARRRSLHQAAADWYAGRDRGLQAEHLELAGDPGAPAAYREAALAQASDYHYDKALSLAGRGRAAAVDDSDRFALDLLRGEFLRELGRAAESRAAFGAALSHADGSLQCSRAQIGIAAADRILSQTESALSALADAQAAAEADGGLLEQAQVHYYRGNILFARGDAKGCLAEHQVALAIAKECGATEWQARALSGLGDAHYSACRMRTALNAFQDCVALCDRHGFGRVALPNRIMMGHCMTYSRQSNGAMAIVREAREIARRSGNPLTEMLANQSLGIVAALSGQLADAARHMTTALNQARNLGARRYEASILVVLAEWALHQGQPAEGLHLASEAVAISREVGMGFVGPHALAVLARATPNPVDRDKALTEGEALLPKSVGHNWIWFYRVAAYAHMDAKNWSEARRCADQMRAVTADEPLPLVEFITGQIYAACDMATPDL